MNPTNTSVDYSIIICTYNPEDRILNRCLCAIDQLHLGTFQVEVIIVDNNSTMPISERDYVRSFLEKANCRYVVREHRSGLSYARVNALKRAKGAYIVFFDDDNEPSENFIVELNLLRGRYPKVGAWGPGFISVEFLDIIDEERSEILRPIFQQKQRSHTEFAMIRQWQDCYPIGTGLCLDNALTSQYVNMVDDGGITMTGRAANLLTSGEDAQIVLLIIAQNYAAGTSPGLRVNHLIPERKTDDHAVQKLILGTSSCYHLFHSEVLPEYKERLNTILVPSDFKLYKRLVKKYYKLRWKGMPLKETIEFIEYLGALSGLFSAKKLPVPPAIGWALNKLKID